jgi:hypothetical protein
MTLLRSYKLKPTIRRMVLFYENGQGPYPAVITKVWSDVSVNLVVFGHPLNPGGLEKTSVILNNDYKEYSWRWDEN